MHETILKNFVQPDEVRAFKKGKTEVVHVGLMKVGRVTYEPGWKWSEHVGRELGVKSCDKEHVGIGLSGRAIVVMDDGRKIELKAGDVFNIGPGHDSWVVGDEPYVSLHLIAAGQPAKKK